MRGILRKAAAMAGIEYRDFMQKLADSGENVRLLAKKYGVEKSRFYHEWAALGIKKQRINDFEFLGVMDSLAGHCRELELNKSTVRWDVHNKGITVQEALTMRLAIQAKQEAENLTKESLK